MATATLPDQTAVGGVDLVAADAARLGSFYREVVGLPEGSDLVRFEEVAGAPAPPPRSTGLFHLAILVPTRRDLALALVRIARARWPLTGASDHLVSEAVYLRDPEGNGIEIYRDRPRSEWQRRGDGIAIDTLPLDLEDVVGELEGEPDVDPGSMPPDTTVGHVHLQVSDLDAAEEFYAGALGFDVTARVPGARFVSAGGYHHHLGFNVWGSQGGPRPAPGSRGLRSWEVVLPRAEDVEGARERLEAAGAPIERTDGGVLAVDPSGNRVLLRSS